MHIQTVHLRTEIGLNECFQSGLTFQSLGACIQKALRP